MRRRRFILKIILVLLILATAAIFYVNKYVLPERAKVFLIQLLEKQLSRKVTLEKISYNPLKGIVLGNLIVFDKEQPDQVFIKAEKINFNCLILPIFREKKLIIPSLNFNGLQINLRRKENGWWNSEDLLSLRPDSALKGNFRPLIYKISLNQIKISVLDNYVQPPFYQEIENSNITANFALPSKINFKIYGQTKDKNPAKFYLKGNYNLSNNFLSWQGNFKNINFPLYAPYYRETIPFIKNMSGFADVTVSGSLDKDMHLALSNDIALQNFSFASEQYSGAGDIKILLQVLADFKESKNIKYGGQANISGFNLNNVPFIQNFSSINGVINFSNNSLSTQNLKGVIYNLPVNLNGRIHDFISPQADLTLTSDLDLSQLKSNLPDSLKGKFDNLDIEGGGFLQLVLNGPLEESVSRNLTAQLIVKNASLKTPLIPDIIEEINGNLSFKNGSFSFERGSFAYNKIAYQLSGTLNNLVKPYIKINASSEKLSLEASLIIDGKDMHINQAQGKYLNYNFDINGDIFDMAKPRINIYANSQFDLADLKDIIPVLIKDMKAEQFANWGVKGNCTTKLFVSGAVNQLKDLEIGLRANCPSLGVKKIKFENAALDLKMKDGGINVLLTSQPYQGNLIAEATVDLNSKNPLYDLKINLSDANLQLLVKDLDLKKKNISGLLSAQGNFRGYGTNLETLKGHAWAEVLEGDLWDMPILGGLANILNIPQLNKVTFKQGHGNFIVGNKEIVTKDLVLLSKEMALSAQGNLNFDGKIDVMVYTSFDPEFLKEISFFGKLLAGFSTIMQYHIYNTITEPKFEKVIAPPSIEEGLPTDFIERFKNILKGKP